MIMNPLMIWIQRREKKVVVDEMRFGLLCEMCECECGLLEFSLDHSRAPHCPTSQSHLLRY